MCLNASGLGVLHAEEIVWDCQGISCFVESGQVARPSRLSRRFVEGSKSEQESWNRGGTLQ